jgi:hypothetical protein
MVCRICLDSLCAGPGDHRLISTFSPYDFCRHKWIIEEGGKHCNLCKAIVFDVNVKWLD